MIAYCEERLRTVYATPIYQPDKSELISKLTRASRSVQAIIITAVVLCTATYFAFDNGNASPALLTDNQNSTLKVILAIDPSTPRRGGTMSLTIIVEKDAKAVPGVIVKILLTFSGGRQNIISGVSDAYGTVTCSIKIPIQTQPGPGRVDVMTRIGNAIAIGSSYFTVK